MPFVRKFTADIKFAPMLTDIELGFQQESYIYGINDQGLLNEAIMVCIVINVGELQRETTVNVTVDGITEGI